ncbi:MAG TPA: superoxide dismutase family protein [Vicinamibacteria bacterium]|nr:superoxide dismutase family protein [Vicinamibacteria bacterium]
MSSKTGRDHLRGQRRERQSGNARRAYSRERDCSTEDAATGHHWNPTSENHGKWGEEPFLLGDIGNIDVQEDGQGTLSITSDLWSLDENRESSVLGESVVVHAGADDFTTQPDGASGDRIGCGVIELKKQT